MLFIAVISNCQWKSIASIKNYILLLLLNFYKNVEPFSNRLSTLYLLRSCPDDITVMSKSLYPNDTISKISNGMKERNSVQIYIATTR